MLTYFAIYVNLLAHLYQHTWATNLYVLEKNYFINPTYVHFPHEHRVHCRLNIVFTSL